jgi:FixJ family two-component response regulator
VSKNQPSIAVVDDEEPVRVALGRLLRSARFAVETFGSGGEFLDSLKTHQPDCVVLDLHMPGLNGFAVQARLLSAGFSLPVVVITGQDSPGIREHVLAGGAAAYLRKPIMDQILLDAIRRAIEAAKPGAS